MEHNKMAEMPVKKLMLTTGAPIILSMVLQAFYNIVDSAFLSNMKDGGEDALTALTLAFPMQVLMIAVGVGTGVGANVLVATFLGKGEKEQASKSAGNSVFMAAVITLIFVLFGIFGVNLYIQSQTDNAEVMQYACEYLRICCIFCIGTPFYDVYEKLLQATGHSGCSTASQITGALLNIVLDPILIYGWFGLPAMGVKGAACATVIGQIAAFLLALVLHFKVNKNIDNRLAYLKPDGKVILEIYKIGFPAIISQALISVMTYGMNIILNGISESLVTAYGLYYKIQQFILMACFGMRDAIMPIAAFGYGMGSKSRLKDTVKYGQIYTFAINFAGFAIIEIFAVPFASVFQLSGETYSLCVSAMHIISLSFVFAGVNIAFQGIFQAIGGGMESLIISVCRQLLFIFPCAVAFANIVKNGAAQKSIIWYTFLIAELLTAFIAVFLYYNLHKRTIGRMESGKIAVATDA